MTDEPTDRTPYVERYDPTGQVDHLATEHLARYEWACGLLPAARVLDCACGPGYGSAMLRRRGADCVVAVDLSPETIDSARERYAAPGIEFLAADALQLTPERVGRFDLIVSLETIEHVREPERLLDVFAALLAPGGTLALSCPNDAAFGTDNPFHFWKERRGELAGWLRRRFASVDAYRELHALGTTIVPGEFGGVDDVSTRTRTLDAGDPGQTMGLLFACSAARARSAAPVTVQIAGGVEYLRRLVRARDWFKMECASWQAAAAAANADLERLRAWAGELEGGRRWAEEQARAWESQARRIDADHVKLRAWVHELESAKHWFEEQARAWEAQARSVADDARQVRAWAEQLERAREELARERNDLAARCAQLDAVVAELRQRLHDLERDTQRSAMRGDGA